MKTYTTDELNETLRLHGLWRSNKAVGSRANLREANLREANLGEANLSGANLREANLREANLGEANLSGANLSRANLGEANLSGANLSGANLREANLREANLSGVRLSRADLSWANLREANLREANLSGANLSWANLSGANLSGANLSGVRPSWANLSRANLSEAIGLPIVTDAPARLLAVAKAALASPDALEMGSWHKCETTHCICGWAEHLGGPLANLIIQTHGNDFGGLILLGVEAHAHFYKSTDQARAFLQSVIDQAEAVK